MSKNLVRYEQDSRVFGVSVGLADYFNIDVMIIRLAFILLTLGGGHGIMIYLVLALLMPKVNDAAPTAKGNVLDEEEIIIKSG
ncbi:MAG: PspC domain-containing protein [Chloroflexota bacterium]